MANLTNINNKFLVQTGGNVGIGSTSPTSPLVVVGTGVGSSGTIGIQGANAHVGFKNSSGTFRSWVGHFNAAGHGSDADLNLKTGYGSVGNIRFSADGDTTAAQMFLQGSTGNVGIGTTSPGRGLTIDKSNANAALEIIKNNTTNQIVYLGTGSSGGTDDPLLRMFHNGTENIRLYTTGDSWINGGSVGIGTTSPGTFYPGNHNLVVGDGNADSAITVYANPANTSYLLFADGTSGSSTYTAQVRYNHSTNHMEFATNNSTTAKMTLDDTGNVGINYTGPFNLIFTLSAASYT